VAVRRFLIAFYLRDLDSCGPPCGGMVPISEIAENQERKHEKGRAGHGDEGQNAREGRSDDCRGNQTCERQPDHLRSVAKQHGEFRAPGHLVNHS
jgi:hypothetical protein